MNKKMIELDGSLGEGGGQILRSSLSLSMITGQPFRIINIRAGRAKPGLLRQHLVAAQAAAAISGAQVTGAELGSTTLEFIPSGIYGGTYQFAIGSAGSCTLVLQTLIPALLYADKPSTIKITGGTHNDMAPPAQFLQKAYGRVLQQMGAEISFELKRYGFVPAGGGEIIAQVQPCKQLKRLDLLERGERIKGYAESFVAGVPVDVAKRELECVGAGMGWTADQLLVRGLSNDQGPGNVLLITLEHEQVTEVFCGFGEKSVKAESVAKRTIQELREYVVSGAALGEHLADQVMLPFALAGGGSFTCAVVSQHVKTNADVIARFLPVTTEFKAQDKRFICTMKHN